MIEEALNWLPCEDCTVTTPTGKLICSIALHCYNCFVSVTVYCFIKQTSSDILALVFTSSDIIYIIYVT